MSITYRTPGRRMILHHKTEPASPTKLHTTSTWLGYSYRIRLEFITTKLKPKDQARNVAIAL